MEIMCRVETEGKSIQRLSHLGIYPIYSHQTDTIVDAHKCWLTRVRYRNIAIIWETLLVHDKYRGRHSQPAIEVNTWSSRERNQGAEGVYNATGETTV